LSQENLPILVEALLRIGLGLRFLNSGLSNLIRWPNPVKNTVIIFPFGATVFGAIAVFLMVAGGLGLVLGFGTRIAALMIALFLIPTFKIQRHWLTNLPGLIGEVDRAIAEESLKSKFRLLARQAFHSHQTGWQANLLMLFLALFFALRGSVAFGLDNFFN
jgi:uncharacterized membrane protein YphA (DoxX/SURF4 family)